MQWSAARLIGAWSLAHFGYRAALIAMPLLALEQTGSAWTIGLVSGAGGLPVILAPWWTGRLQIRLRSARCLGALLAAEGVGTLVVPGSAAVNRLTPALMIAAGLAVGLLNAVSGPLNAGLVAALGDRSDTAGQQVGAARLLSAQDSAVKIAMTIAPLLTLPLLAAIGATWTVALEGFLSLVAAALSGTLRLTSHERGRTACRPRVRTLLADHPEIKTGWAVRGVGCAAWFAFTLGLTLLGEQHGRGVLLAVIGLTSYSAAAVVGSGLGVLTASARRPALVNSVTWLVAGVGWLTIAAAPGPLVIAITAAGMGLAVPAGNAATIAMVTRSFTGLERRAALTAQATVVTGSTTLGMLVGGPVIAAVGPQAAIGLAGLAVIAAAGSVAWREYRRGEGPNRAAERPDAGTMRHERRDGELPRLQRG